MEEFFINILQFIIYLVTLIPAVWFMLTSGTVLRRIVFLVAVVCVIKNELIAVFLYMLIVGILETVLAVLGLVFFILLAVVFCLLPIILFIKRLFNL